MPPSAAVTPPHHEDGSKTIQRRNHVKLETRAEFSARIKLASRKSGRQQESARVRTLLSLIVVAMLLVGAPLVETISMEFEIVRGASFCEGDGVGYSARRVERALIRSQSTDKQGPDMGHGVRVDNKAKGAQPLCGVVVHEIVSTDDKQNPCSRVRRQRLCWNSTHQVIVGYNSKVGVGVMAF